ncbi:MAG: hypothetical protein KAT90_08565, partial [Gammaproteobacteria bacterium]|nr:hypothetical protein [Gammaproteobacteria bacterium]
MRKSGLLFLCLPLTMQAEEFSFDISSYEKPLYEFGGFIEPSATHSKLNTDSALYNLQLANTNPVTNNDLYSAGLQLEGLYRFTDSQINFQYFVESQDSDISENQHESLFYELYYTSNHLNNITIDLGKRVQKWGKGYAWNPAGFIERKKDPNDPELSREGYVMLTADYVRSYDHDLKTLAIMPVV